MCLSVDLRRTRLAKRASASRKPVTRFKRVKVEFTQNGELRIKSQHFSHQWKPGFHHCGRGQMPVVDEKHNSRDIERAIHVFTTKSRATPTGGESMSSVVLQVECFPEDLIAVGRNGTEEAYMQVYLTKEEYDRIITKYTKLLLKNVAADGDAKYTAVHGRKQDAA